MAGLKTETNDLLHDAFQWIFPYKCAEKYSFSSFHIQTTFSQSIFISITLNIKNICKCKCMYKWIHLHIITVFAEEHDPPILNFKNRLNYNSGSSKLK
jgi:hypothetical protein